MTAAPHDPIGANRQMLVGDVHARARSTFTPSPIMRGAIQIARTPDIIRMPRMVDLVGGSTTPFWTKGLAASMLTAQLDQVRLLTPSLQAALASATTRPLVSPALMLAQPRPAAFVAPVLSALPRVAPGLGSARADRITRDFVDLIDAEEPALDSRDAHDVVNVLAREDAATQLVELEAMQFAVLDVVESDPFAELMEYIDPVVESGAGGDTTAGSLDEATSSTLAAFRGRLSALSTGEITTVLLASSSLVSTATLEMFGIDPSFIGRHLSLPMGILAIASSIRNVNEAARERGRRDDSGNSGDNAAD